MVIRLIMIIISLVFIAFFAGFNLDNKCDVNLVFHAYKNVPVFFTILLSFAFGLACALPFALIHKKRKERSGLFGLFRTENKQPKKNEETKKQHSGFFNLFKKEEVKKEVKKEDVKPEKVEKIEENTQVKETKKTNGFLSFFKSKNAKTNANKEPVLSNAETSGSSK